MEHKTLHQALPNLVPVHQSNYFYTKRKKMTTNAPCGLNKNIYITPNPKANDRSYKNENIKISTQNVQGLKSEEKTEYNIIRLMGKHKNQAFFIKELHLAQDSELPVEFFLLHYNKKTTTTRGTGGVAIILSKEWGTQWKQGVCITREEQLLLLEKPLES